MAWAPFWRGQPLMVVIMIRYVLRRLLSLLHDSTQQSLGVTSNFGVTYRSMIALTRLGKAQRSSSRLAANPSLFRWQAGLSTV